MSGCLPCPLPKVSPKFTPYRGGGRAVSEGNSRVGKGEPWEGKYRENPKKQTSGEFAHTRKNCSDSALHPNTIGGSFRHLDCCFGYQS